MARHRRKAHGATDADMKAAQKAGNARGGQRSSSGQGKEDGQVKCSKCGELVARSHKARHDREKHKATKQQLAERRRRAGKQGGKAIPGDEPAEEQVKCGTCGELVPKSHKARHDREQHQASDAEMAEAAQG